jgi:hypothetical protein
MIHFTIGVTTATHSSSRFGFIVTSSASIASNIRASMIALILLDSYKQDKNVFSSLHSCEKWRKLVNSPVDLLAK